ncbi:MAG: hypothetical protein AAF620_18110, partial [Bacteroidota bacterium]
RGLAALNKYFDNEVSGKKSISKIESGFLEVPFRLTIQNYLIVFVYLRHGFSKTLNVPFLSCFHKFPRITMSYFGSSQKIL